VFKKNETILTGKWIIKSEEVVEDDVTKRIKKLINNNLIKISNDITGWDTLYIDPNDNRYWELVYKDSDLQGGGAPSLINISKEKAKLKYNI